MKRFIEVKPLFRNGILLLCGVLAGACAEAQLLAQLDEKSSSGPQITTAVPAPTPVPQTVSGHSVTPVAGDATTRQQRIGNDLARRALKAMPRSTDQELEDYLNAIVQRLQATSAHGPGQMRYQVYLVDSPQANAFTPGGGHIFVTTGIVTKLRTEAQMAMVLAHEMAHNQANHVVKGQDGQSLNRRVTAFGRRVFDEGLGVPWLSSGVKALADTSLSTYTRAQEEEADVIGLQYFVAAGYDPFEAPRSFAALIEVNAQKKSIFDVFDGYPQGIKRAESMNATVHSRYRGVDTSGLIRNSRAYVKLASAYWQ